MYLTAEVGLKEKDGIFLWALQGYQRLRQRGYFEEDTTVTKEVDEYKKENNNVISFVEDKCEIHEGLKVSKAELFEKYKTWCQENGFHPLSLLKFGKELRRNFNLKDHKRAEGWYWLNVDVLN